MAKNKRSVALFEVINSGKVSSARETLRTPKWWFKRKKADGTPAPGPTIAAAEPVLGKVDPDSNAPAPHVPGVDLKLDTDRQRISFQLTYTSALVAGFAVIVTIGLAYLVGSRLSRGPTPAVAGMSTEQIRQGPVQNQVLNLTASSSRPASAGAARRPQPQVQQQPAPEPVSTTVTPTPATLPAGQRIVGLNYIIAQSYPDEKLAIEARDLLLQNSIPATIERRIVGWPNLYCVVGLKGFDRVRTTEYERYLKSIVDLNAKFTRNPKFQSFAPTGYKWTGRE